MRYILTVAVVMLFLVGLSDGARAATDGSNEVQVVATVNIFDAKIVRQEKNVFTLSFDIMNRLGAQGNIRLSAALFNTDGKKVDQKEFDAVLSLSTEETLHQEVVYEVAETLEGEYILGIEATNDAGLTFATVPLGTIRVGDPNAPAAPIIAVPAPSVPDTGNVVIRNVVFDKDGYRKGDMAQLSYFYMGARERVKKIEAKLIDGQGASCADVAVRVLEQPVFVGRISLPVSRECMDPQVSLLLKGDEGSILSEHMFSVVTKQMLPLSQGGSESRDSVWKTSFQILMGVIPIAILAIMILWRNARRRSIYGRVAVFFVVLSGVVFSNTSAQADTIVVAGWPFQVSLDKAVYTLSPYPDSVWGDYSVHMDPVTSMKNYQGMAHISSAICANCLTVGVTYPNGVYQGFGPGNSFWNTSAQTFTAGFGSHVASHTPGTPGNYVMNFRILVQNINNTIKEDVTYGIPYTVVAQTPINGVCGLADGGSYASAPSSGLCAAGSSTPPVGTGPWSWDCVGAWGGTSESCQATVAACAPNNAACASTTCTTDTCFDGCTNIPGTKTCSACVPNNSGCAEDTCTSNTCWNGCDYIFGTKDCSVTSTLKICEDTCTSGIRRDGSGFSVLLGSTKSLSACFGTGSCSGNDAEVTGTWTATNTPENAVSVSPATNVGQTVLSALAAGSENVNLTRNGKTVSTLASVICIVTSDACDDTSAEAQQTCQGETYTKSYTNNCTNTVDSKSCPGVRTCGGYKEVAP